MRSSIGLLFIFSLAACSGNSNNLSFGDLAGPHDLSVGGDDLATACVSDLSNLGSGDFQIAFTIQTTQIGQFAIANQRASCSTGTAWDLRVNQGFLLFEVGDPVDGGLSTELTGCAKLNDGHQHHVLVQRAGGTLADYVDGIADAHSVASSTSFGALPPLTIRNDVCVGVDGTQKFDASIGTINGFCIALAASPAPTAPDGGQPFCP